ncbi:hypothetical protein BD413DRAFT_507529 [Trametes elegans]|nr:hypothetical protein BD413DRAFT_507529 [Trametes elegans]
MKGNLQAAQAIRLQGAPDNIACVHYNCANLSNALSTLSRYTAYQAVYYCSQRCQSADWRPHKKYCRRIEAVATAA